MTRASMWNVLVLHLRHVRETQVARAEKRHLHGELKRLLVIGEHLIRDVGLDPRHVRDWLETNEEM